MRPASEDGDNTTRLECMSALPGHSTATVHRDLTVKPGITPASGIAERGCYRIGKGRRDAGA